MTMTKTLEIEYFALFREIVGHPSESVETTAQNPEELFAFLQQQHSGLQSLSNMKVAINDQLSPWDATLNDGDRVLLFPPVAGG